MSLSSIGNSLSSLASIGSSVQTSSQKNIKASDATTAAAVKETFLNYAHMNPVERMRANYLKSINVTEEELSSLPTQEREKIERAIKELIERKLGKNNQDQATTGQCVNVLV